MSAAKKNVEGEVKVPPALEWVIASPEDFRAALPAMMKFRKLSQEDLGWKMVSDNGSPRMLFSGFLRGAQSSVNLRSFLDAMDAMDLEVIVRRKSEKMSKRRLDALRARVGKEGADAELASQGRDSEGKLLDVSSLNAEQRAEVDALLTKYGSYK